MNTELTSVLNYWRNYELDRVTRHFLDALLDDVISILIIDTIQNAVLELRYQQLLLVKLNHLQSLLDYSATIHRLGQLKHVLEQLVS